MNFVTSPFSHTSHVFVFLLYYFCTVCRGTISPNDTIIVYYSGHGNSASSMFTGVAYLCQLSLQVFTVERSCGFFTIFHQKNTEAITNSRHIFSAKGILIYSLTYILSIASNRGISDPSELKQSNTTDSYLLT